MFRGRVAICCNWSRVFLFKAGRPSSLTLTRIPGHQQLGSFARYTACFKITNAKMHGIYSPSNVIWAAFSAKVVYILDISEFVCLFRILKLLLHRTPQHSFFYSYFLHYLINSFMLLLLFFTHMPVIGL